MVPVEARLGHKAHPKRRIHGPKQRQRREEARARTERMRPTGVEVPGEGGGGEGEERGTATEGEKVIQAVTPKMVDEHSNM